jgi:hypothetical protein
MITTETAPLHFYISTGKNTKMYTLRLMSKVFRSGAGLTKDEYWTNLSTNWNTATQKAQHIAREQLIELKLGSSFDLDEIRRNAEQEINEHLKEEQEREEQRRVQIEQQTVEQTNAGIILIGQYKGQPVEDVYAKDPSWVRYIANNPDGEHSIYAITQKICKNYVDSLPQQESVDLGNIDDLISVQATFVKTVSFQGVYGVSHLHIFNTTGNVINCYSSAKKFFDLKQGDVVTIKGTIKSIKNDTKTGDKVTVLNKPKLV